MSFFMDGIAGIADTPLIYALSFEINHPIGTIYINEKLDLCDFRLRKAIGSFNLPLFPVTMWGWFRSNPSKRIEARRF